MRQSPELGADLFRKWTPREGMLVFGLAGLLFGWSLAATYYPSAREPEKPTVTAALYFLSFGFLAGSLIGAPAWYFAGRSSLGNLLLRILTFIVLAASIGSNMGKLGMPKEVNPIYHQDESWTRMKSGMRTGSSVGLVASFLFVTFWIARVKNDDG